MCCRNFSLHLPVPIPQVGQEIHDAEKQAGNVLHAEEERRELLNDIGRDVDTGNGALLYMDFQQFEVL